ncbi:MAG: M15 family metallopeptidase [Deltaproteobacteria bacterium]|nr:M15 family metallopeptidase [Deltaproteobacteria bacterium]
MPFLAALLLSLAPPNPPDRPSGLKCLVEAYPDFLSGAEPFGTGARCEGPCAEGALHSTQPGTDSGWHIVWKDGTRMPWDDGKKKSHEEKLAGADLEDMMSQPYPAGRKPEPPAENDDPGRIRHEPFFLKMYGSTAHEAEARLGPVQWVAGCKRTRLRATTVNRVNLKLEAVARDIEKLPEETRKLACDLSGPYTWRKVRGTDRLSAHSFGIAIDVALDKADFWRWNKPDATGRRAWKNRVPADLVEAFERHGFIWGGRWYHFDTMHFEYRPELLQCGSRDERPTG